MLVSCCPGGSSSNVFSMLAKGDVMLSVTLTAFSSVITLFTLPIVMEFAITSSPFIFNSGEIALAAIIYALLMNVFLLTYVYFIRKKLK